MVEHQRTSKSLFLIPLIGGVACFLWSTGCLLTPPVQEGDGDADADADSDPETCPDTEHQPTRGADCEEIQYFDDLSAHPGCSLEPATEGRYAGIPLAYEPAVIPGYRCAAKAYPNVGEDPSTPIVLLIHGNADNMGGYETWPIEMAEACDEAACSGATAGQPMLAETLSSAGFRVYAIDMRHDRLPQLPDNPDDCDPSNPICNMPHSFNHGWATPLTMHFIRSVMEANPERRVALIGHSLGVTIIRDALRRLFTRDGFNPYPQVAHVIGLSGGNRGVSETCGASECGVNNTLRGDCACEIGNRDAYMATCFQRALSGPEDQDHIPCADGCNAYGAAGVCGDHSVRYTTLVMADREDGTQEDLCVSERSSRLDGADNRTIAVESKDESCYFLCGVLRNHFSSARSQEAIDTVLSVLRPD